eukprot:346727_1
MSQSHQHHVSLSKLLNSGFLQTIQRELVNIKCLYDTGNSTKVDGHNILKNFTLNEISQCHTDFRATNIAVANLMQKVSDIFFDKCIKKIYNHAAQTDLNKLDKNLVKMQILKVAEEAKNISHAFKEAGHWYFKLASEIHQACTDSKNDEEEVKNELQHKIDNAQDKMDEADKAYDSAFKQAFIPIWGFTQIKPANAAVDEYNHAADEYNHYVDEQRKASPVLGRIVQLIQSLEAIGQFCSDISAWFKQTEVAYFNFGGIKSEMGAQINEEWKSWKPEQCKTWILSLKHGYFKKYIAKIGEVFAKKNITGDVLPQLGVYFFKKKIGTVPNDAKMLVDEIQLLSKQSNLSYETFKANYNTDMKWISCNKSDLNKVSNALLLINQNCARLNTNTQPSTFTTVKLHLCGTDYIYAPQKAAKQLMCKGNTLLAGCELKNGEYLLSTDGTIKFVMQQDGNLVSYKRKGNGWTWVWDTFHSYKVGKVKDNPCRLVMQLDSNLCLYTSKNKCIWDTWHVGNAGHIYDRKCKLVVQNNGIYLYTSKNKVFWKRKQ